MGGRSTSGIKMGEKDYVGLVAKLPPALLTFTIGQIIAIYFNTNPWDMLSFALYF